MNRAYPLFVAVLAMACGTTPSRSDGVGGGGSAGAPMAGIPSGGAGNSAGQSANGGAPAKNGGAPAKGGTSASDATGGSSLASGGMSGGTGGPGSAGSMNAQNLRAMADAECAPLCDLEHTACPAVSVDDCLGGCTVVNGNAFAANCGQELYDAYACITMLAPSSVSCSPVTFNGCGDEQARYNSCL